MEQAPSALPSRRYSVYIVIALSTLFGLPFLRLIFRLMSIYTPRRREYKYRITLSANVTLHAFHYSAGRLPAPIPLNVYHPSCMEVRLQVDQHRGALDSVQVHHRADVLILTLSVLPGAFISIQLARGMHASASMASQQRIHREAQGLVVVPEEGSVRITRNVRVWGDGNFYGDVSREHRARDSIAMGGSPSRSARPVEAIELPPNLSVETLLHYETPPPAYGSI